MHAAGKQSMMANRRTTKPKMTSSSSSLVLKNSVSSAQETILSMATKVPISDTKESMIPPRSALSMKDSPKSNVEQTFLSPSLIVPVNPPQASAPYSFAFSHRRVTPIPALSADVQRSITPIKSADLLLAVKTKNDESTPHLATNAMFSPDAILAAADAVVEPTTRGSYEPPHYHGPYPSSFFPVIVYRMIDSASRLSGSHSLMHWNDAGDKFWIDQNSPKLSMVLKRHFKHDRYQSLRRQLNAYGFKKELIGPEKGYWYHEKLRQNSTFEEIERFAYKPNSTYARRFGISAKGIPQKQQAQDPDNYAMVSSKADSSLTEKRKAAAVPQPNQQKRLPIKGKATYSKPSPTKVADRANKKKSKVRKVTLSKAAVSTSESVEMHEDDFLGLAISSIADFAFFSMEEVEGDVLGKDFHQNSSSDDALSALATLASCLPDAPTIFDSPGEKGFILPTASTIHFSPIITESVEDSGVAMETEDTTKSMYDESESLDKALLMVVDAEKDHLLVPTPIKLTSNSYVDISRVFELGSDNGDCMDEDHMSHSLGSLSSPYKSLLPPGDRSAFTPIVSRTDLMISEMYDLE